MTRARKPLGIIVVVLILAFIIVMTPFSLVTRSRPHIDADICSPVGCLREINTAEVTYATTYPKIGFSPSLAWLGGSSSGTPGPQRSGLVDSDLASGEKAGYRFTYAVIRDEKSGLNIAYAAHADPDVHPIARAPRNLLEVIFPPKPEPERYFYTDQSGVIRHEKNHEANANSPML